MAESPEQEIQRLRAEIEELKAASDAPARSWNREVEVDWARRQKALESWLGGADGAHYVPPEAPGYGPTVAWHPAEAMRPDLADVVRKAVNDLHENG